ncbi:MAG: TetR/AcrR family transcriptional regulator [Planctomycetota bacterium]|jgi:AcrR family transcriptional regulator
MESQKPEQAFDPGGRSRGDPRNLEGRESYDERLNRILEAATGVIARDGYQKASMRTIAGSAGVSLAGLYHYFDSKDRMLFLIQFRTFSALVNNLREKLHGVEDPVEQLQVLVRAHVTYFAANMAALKVCSHELDSLTGPAYDETHRIRREYYELSRAIIDRLLEHYAPEGALDARIVTMSLFGTLNWLYRWYDPKKDRAPSVLAGQISTQFLQGVLGVPSVPVGGRQPSGARR